MNRLPKLFCEEHNICWNNGWKGYAEISSKGIKYPPLTDNELKGICSKWLLDNGYGIKKHEENYIITNFKKQYQDKDYLTALIKAIRGHKK